MSSIVDVMIKGNKFYPKIYENFWFLIGNFNEYLCVQFAHEQKHFLFKKNTLKFTLKYT